MLLKYWQHYEWLKDHLEIFEKTNISKAIDFRLTEKEVPARFFFNNFVYICKNNLQHFDFDLIRRDLVLKTFRNKFSYLNNFIITSRLNIHSGEKS